MALETRLATLSDEAKAVYMALALLEEPDASLVREALDLSASAFSQTQVVLIGSGLIEPSGQIRARPAALNYLQNQPNLKAKIALRLARQLGGQAALPLYRYSKTLWEAADLKQVRQSYLAWGQELMKRGFPQRAAEALAEINPTPEIGLFRARALERAGQYREAFEVLSAVPESLDQLALKGTLLWRLGKAEEARMAATQALDGDILPRAEALNTLGALALFEGSFQEALGHFRRSAALWLGAGEKNRWIATLNNVAITRSELGESTEEAFKEVLQATQDSPESNAMALLNLGEVYRRKSNFTEAIKAFNEAATKASAAGALHGSTLAWNNLGFLYQGQKQFKEAEEAYRRALALSRETGDVRLIATVMVNLAELMPSEEMFEEAMRLLGRSKHQDLVDRYKPRLEKLKSNRSQQAKA